jgi:curli biogenesis system outer membrane secretion channel CsgG/anti-sigma factor RsiW
MQNDHKSAESMRAYLLGQLPEHEAAALEEQYFVNRDCFLRVQSEETALIADYLDSRLPKNERHVFESRYLHVPELQRRVEEIRQQRSILSPAVPSTSWVRWSLAATVAIVLALGFGARHSLKKQPDSSAQSQPVEEKSVLPVQPRQEPLVAQEHEQARPSVMPVAPLIKKALASVPQRKNHPVPAVRSLEEAISAAAPRGQRMKYFHFAAVRAMIEADAKAEAISAAATRGQRMKYGPVTQSKVALVSGNTLIVDVGRKVGLKVGDKMEITRVVRRTGGIQQINNPAERQALKLVFNNIGEGTVIEVGNEFAVLAFLGTESARVGDMAETPIEAVAQATVEAANVSPNATNELNSTQATTIQRKKLVAVLDFDYGTVQSYVSAIYGSNQDVGKGITDMLVEKLEKDGNYTVIERKRLDKVLTEQNFSNSDRADPTTAAKLANILGVDAIIVGSIVKFGRDDEPRYVGGVGVGARSFGISGVKKSEGKAVCAITVRLIDATTGEILAAVTGEGESKRSGTSLVGGGGGRDGVSIGGFDSHAPNFGQTLLGEAVTQAVDSVGAQLNTKTASLPTRKVEAQ